VRGPCQKNTLPAVKLELATLKMLIQAFYQLSYPDPLLQELSRSLVFYDVNAR